MVRTVLMVRMNADTDALRSPAASGRTADPRRRSGRGVTAFAALLGLAVGCGGGGDPLCAARDDLEESVETLRDVNLREDGVEAYLLELSDVLEALDQVADETQVDRDDEINAVRRAYNDFSEALTAVPAQPTAEAFGAVDSGLRDTTASMEALVDELARDCE
jgi:hypothetical protein